MTTSKFRFPREGTAVETTDEYGNVDRGLFRGIQPGKPNGGSVRERADKVIIDAPDFAAHIPINSLRSIKRIPQGMLKKAK